MVSTNSIALNPMAATTCVGSGHVTVDSPVSKRLTCPFPTLQLSSENASELETLAHKLIVSSIKEYESFLLDNHNRVDELRWKFVSSKENLRAYAKQARPMKSTHSHQANMPVADLPVVMITGTIVGDLDDIMYGVACWTTEQVRVNLSYAYDEFPRCAVLSTLVYPTVENPFNMAAIKWVEYLAPLVLRPVIKHRDFVYMDTTGVERLRNGERVGYHIVHSVQFPETPTLDTHTRGNSSISILYRQRTKNVTDVFIKGFFNSAEGIMRTMLIRATTRMLFSVAKSIYCSHTKKLAWALRQRHNAEASSTSSGCTDGSSCAPSDDKRCFGCGKKQSVFVQAASQISRGSKILQKKRQCKICMHHMCVDCRRQHQLIFLLSDQRLKQHLVTICRSCEFNALSESAVGIARKEMLLSNQVLCWDTISGLQSE
ncbi:unnamed protein product [Peronospora farinosa]|uniref:FYVE-type domain-containing protein n=1 Tax=Peronospora farinosa TaxID=134698 RepID=A0AAV0SU95_9STRA|nr:unnamed protein product [Peronospora farinosa]CAI5708236.1 unnamed protein product [Peronospora farinosa]